MQCKGLAHFTVTKSVTKDVPVAGKIRYLLNRNGRYYARLVVPEQARPFLDGKSELRTPLGADRQEALRRHPVAIAEQSDATDVTAGEQSRGGGEHRGRGRDDRRGRGRDDRDDDVNDDADEDFDATGADDTGVDESIDTTTDTGADEEGDE